MRQSPTSRYAAPLARASTWRACWSLLAASWLALAFGTAATAATFTFAGSHSSVTISWSHAGLSRHSARIVGVDGTLEFEPADPQSATVEARLDPARLSTGVPALDRLLRSPDFFDVASHPVIAFRSTAARITGERTGEVLGDLTVAGVTRPVALTVTWNFAGEHPLGLVNPSFAGKFVAGFSATTKILRSEWNLGRGAPLISDEVDVAIEVEAVRR